MASTEVVEAFCKVLKTEPTEALRDAVTAAVVCAHTDWPADWLADASFAAYLAGHIEADDVIGSLERCMVSDLYVAASTVAGHSQALAIFARELQAATASALGKLGASAEERAEVSQQLRQKLLVTTRDRQARLHDYEGRGSLRSWLRAIAGRTYLNMKRGEKREVLVDDDGVLDALHEGNLDLELVHMRDMYRTQFREAFLEALDGLTDRQKVLLRYRFVDQVSVDKIGKIYQVHRGTVHRWLAEARQALAAQTEALLRDKLRLTPSEFHSIRRLVVSQLDISLVRFLESRKSVD